MNIQTKKPIVTLGPVGTYSHQATEEYFNTKDIRFEQSLHAVVRSVALGTYEYGIVPIENSIHGLVFEALYGIDNEQLVIADQCDIPIEHTVSTLHEDTPYDEITEIHSHEQALGQCYDYLEKTFPNAKLFAKASTSEGFQEVVTKGLSTVAVIGSTFSAHQFGLFIREQDIQDQVDNKTTFAVITKRDICCNTFDSTILVLSPSVNNVGILASALEVFRDFDINLSNVSSRPQRDGSGLHKFYVMLDCSSSHENFEEILQKLKDLSIEVKMLTA